MVLCQLKLEIVEVESTLAFMDSLLHASWESKLKWVRHCAINQLDL